MKLFAILLLICCGIGQAAPASPAKVQTLKITILSTMVAESGTSGEWGFSALLEADGHRILVDTGAAPDTVLRNARAMEIDLSSVEDVVLTHNHSDHTGGLVTLRQELGKLNPHALARAHLASAALLSRPRPSGEVNALLKNRAAYEQAGGTFVIHDQPTEIFPGIWFTGPVPRKFPERNWSGDGVLVNADGARVEDTIPEDSSILINTARGVVLLSGCGHAGVVNTMTYARQLIPSAPVSVLVGGFHLYALDDARLDWTLGQFKQFGVRTILGAHCTGFEAVYRARRRLGLDRSAAIVAAVGSTYSLSEGIEPGGSGLVR